MKYNNKKVEYKDIKFDSKMEKDYYIYLLENKDKLEIKDIELQPKFILQEKFKYNNKTIRSITYKADFKVIYKDRIEVVDVKGVQTDVFKIKKKLLLNKYKDINFKCIRKVKNEWKEI